MNRSLRLDVVQDDADLILVLNLGGDVAVDDFLEDGLGHGRELKGKGAKRQRFKAAHRNGLLNVGPPLGGGPNRESKFEN